MANDYVRGLKQRRAGFQEEREKLIKDLTTGNQRLLDLNGAIAGIDQLLKLEGVKPELPHAAEVAATMTLPIMLKALLTDRKYHTVDELIEKLRERAFQFGEKNPRRVVSFTLLGMSRGGKYQSNEDGSWRFIG